MSASKPHKLTANSLSGSLKPFFANLDSFVEVDGGVAKLRELILDLAVRGKLVDQERDGESACDLLARICDAGILMVTSLRASLRVDG